MHKHTFVAKINDVDRAKEILRGCEFSIGGVPTFWEVEKISNRKWYNPLTWFSPPTTRRIIEDFEANYVSASPKRTILDRAD